MRHLDRLLRAGLVAAALWAPLLAVPGCAHRAAMPAAATPAAAAAPPVTGPPAATAAPAQPPGAPAASPTAGVGTAAVPPPASSPGAATGAGPTASDAAGIAPDSTRALPLPGSATDGAEPAPAWPPMGHDEPTRAGVSAPESLAAFRSAVGPIDYLWVVRTALVDSASVDSVVERARRMGVRGLLVQVVGRGDAWYRSELLPRPEALAGTPEEYDPLGRILTRAHAAGLEVHAWMNCMLVWSAPKPPRDVRHVLHAHPEWVAMLSDGRRMTALGPRTLDRLGVEGVFLAPAHPRVRTWVASIAAEIAGRYPVDGVHLDYIRCPDVETGFDPNTRARFAMAHGIDPQRITFAPAGARWTLLRQLRAFQREQVTAVVREVRDSLQSRRPGLPLSAAVVADTTRTEGLAAQAWREWIHDGLLDRAYPMCYSPDVQRVMSQLLLFRRTLGANDRIVPGIAVYNTTPATAAVKIKGARVLGYPMLALYSYDALFAENGRWSMLERGLENATLRGSE